MKILLINGPNLQLLGVREPGIYGGDTLPEIVASNHEGAIVDRIGSARADGFVGIVMNPAAYTHTSVAIRDALAAVKLPAVEVHLSNIHAREEFRHTSLTAPMCIGVVAGFGADSYLLALRGLIAHLEK